MMDRKIGIIGGMGPKASQLFYKMVTDLTDASCDQDHVNMVILSDTSMPDRTEAILAGDYDEVANRLLADGKMLADCGCLAVGITCNTAHFFADLIEERLEIPVIHMIKETVNRIAEKKPSAKAAVLATDGTIKTGIYQKRMEEAGLCPYILPGELQEIVMYQIYDRIKCGKPWDAGEWDLLENHLKEAGCDYAVMACTELSVIKNDNGLGDFYIDPMQILAEQVIRLGGKKLKKTEISTERKQHIR